MKNSISSIKNRIIAKPITLDENSNEVKSTNINVLKARAQEIENKESRKNISIFIFFLLILGVFGIYLSI